MQRAIRIVSTMLITAGILVLADAGLTLVWQEPLSAAYGSLEQGRAEDQLKDLEAQYPSPADLAAIAGASGSVAKARITSSLQKGPGHYMNTALPGQPGTVAIAGHRTTYLAPFRHIDQIEDGDEIRIEMPYAAFTYSVQRHEIVDPSDVGILKPVGYDQLVMTACHPPYSASHRYAVFAKLARIDLFAVSGEGRWPTP